jgi:hypothetical protein
MNLLERWFELAEPYVDDNGEIGLAAITRLPKRELHVRTLDQWMLELGEDGQHLSEAVLAEIRTAPWLDQRCLLPYKPNADDDDPSLCKDVELYIREHVELTNPEYYTVLANWVLASYVQERLIHAPRIVFYAPTRSGKTRALGTLKALSYRGFEFLDPTGPAVFRTIERYHPTVFIDEGQRLILDYQSTLGCVFKGGFEKGGCIPRTNEEGIVDLFRPFGFMAIATKILPPEDWQNRAILINMQEKLSHSIRRTIDYEAARKLRTRLIAFRLRALGGRLDLDAAITKASELAARQIFLADGRTVNLDDRAMDIATSLLVPSSVFGGSAEILTVIAASQDLAKEELLWTMEAKVFFALQSVFRRNGTVNEIGEFVSDVKKTSTKDVQVQLNIDLKNQGDAGKSDIPTIEVTRSLKTLGFAFALGAQNKSYFVAGEAFDRAWKASIRKFCDRSEGN